MRLSNFAQDALLSMIYHLEDIDEEELSQAEKNILATARTYDRERTDETTPAS